MQKFFPEQASEVADKVDWLNSYITNWSVVCTVVICAAMLYFAIKYRRRDGVDHSTPQILDNHFLEIVWTVFPTIVCVFVAIYGFQVYRDLRRLPADTSDLIEINTVGRQWVWDFEYANGKKVSKEVVIPVGKQAKFLLSATDVLHSFFVPAMRVKSDAIPGAYTYVTFKPVKTGEYNIFCTEYCGKDHSGMIAKLRVVSEAEYNRWLNDKSAEEAALRMSPVDLGRKLYNDKGCNACHSLTGAPGVGPTFKGLYMKLETLVDESKVSCDETYLRESILNSGAKLVKGFSPIMPAFEGQLKENEVNALIAFIKNVDKEVVAAPAPVVAASATEDLTKLTPVQLGEHIYNTKLCATCHSLDGSARVGPTFKGIFGRTEKIVGGTTVKVDEAYIKESLMSPAAKVVEGFSPSMPPYQGQLSDKEVEGVIEYLKTVK